MVTFEEFNIASTNHYPTWLVGKAHNTVVTSLKTNDDVICALDDIVTMIKLSIFPSAFNLAM